MPPSTRIIARAVAEALTQYRRRNASFAGDYLVLHRLVNPGIAVDLNFERPMVPVVEDAAAIKLARAVHDLTDRATRASCGPTT
jgi:2-oxoglutarate dehydrogenase E2 component (dihydrolipoamide succinyltransferase)